ncbi:hypothetical protein [Parasphingorhabdus sp.]|uniref:hypothetical protein n=1 Tax=Parasphingorhabdus sp. TaxID=2709688 RepID=UPI00359331F2
MREAFILLSYRALILYSAFCLQQKAYSIMATDFLATKIALACKAGFLSKIADEDILALTL